MFPGLGNILKIFILFLFIILAPVPALASEPISMGSELLRTAWALLVVIGLILCIYGLLRKRFGLGALQQGNIKVVEIKHIMPKSSIALVEVNNRRLLIGVTSGGINLLADFIDEKEITTEKTSLDFKTILAKKQ